jgi:hypothetical protein
LYALIALENNEFETRLEPGKIASVLTALFELSIIHANDFSAIAPTPLSPGSILQPQSERLPIGVGSAEIQPS